MKSSIILKALENKKSYRQGDMVIEYVKKKDKWVTPNTYIEFRHFDDLTAKIEVTDHSYLPDKHEYMFQLRYFNPQTQEDCHAINFILATLKGVACHRDSAQDYGNCDMVNNQYIFRQKRNFYSFALVWQKGEVDRDNFDKDLSYEFATDEYVSHLRYIYRFKRLQRRTIKKNIRVIFDKLIISDKMKRG